MVSGSGRPRQGQVIGSPGRNRPVESSVGPIVQPGTLDSEVIHVGGRDETINVHIKAGDGIHRCITTQSHRAPLGATHLRRAGTRPWQRNLVASQIG